MTFGSSWFTGHIHSSSQSFWSNLLKLLLSNMLIRRGWPCPDPCCWSRRGKTTHTRARGSAAWPQFRFWPLVALVVLTHSRGRCSLRPVRRRRRRRRCSGSPCWWPRYGGGCPPPPRRGSRWKKRRKTEVHLQREKSRRDYSTVLTEAHSLYVDVAKLWHIIELETLRRRGREIKQHLIRWV